MKDNRRGPGTAVFCFLALTFVGSDRQVGQAVDWPTHQSNAQRNAVTDQQLALPLGPVWVHEARHAPQPAWPLPAQQDFWHGESNLAPRVDFDHAYHVAVAGDALLYGSSAEHAVHCLDVATGAVRWSFFTEGPVRFAPVVHQGKVYFGAEDGCVYCLRIGEGDLVWKYRPSSVDRRLPGNGHVISLWPIRTGLAIEGPAVYGAAGLFPEHGVYVFALELETGKELWKRTIAQPAQGYLAADAGALWIPSGRAGMMAVRLRDGMDLGTVDSCGTYLVAAQSQVFCESSRYQRQLLIRGSLTTPAHFVTVKGETAYFQGPNELVALRLAPYVQRGAELAGLRGRHKKLSEELSKVGNRDPVRAGALRSQLDALRGPIADLEDQLKNKFHLWKRGDKPAFSLVLAGDTLFFGRNGSVAAARTSDGAEVWTAKVAGRAYGLAVATGRLFVSTDEGRIYCFRSGAASPQPTLKFPEVRSPFQRDDLDSAYAAAAETIVNQLPIRKGYALVLDCGEGRLAYELARRSDLQIVGVEADERKAAKARENLARAGLLGRVNVHHLPGGRLPYPRYFANLIVSDAAVVSGKLPTHFSEIQRVLRPYGGVAIFGGEQPTTTAAEQALRKAAGENDWVVTGPGSWVSLHRGRLVGAGEWTHQYANPANTASSGDTLVRGPLVPLWFGEPGPRDMIDRHNRTMAPLFKDGCLFVPANERVIALDAYNGTRLWEIDVPGSRRLGVMKDAAHMALAGQNVYVAVADKCWGLNIGTGKRDIVYQAPQPAGKEQYKWGYLAAVADRVFGTIETSGASFNKHGNLCSLLEGDFRPVIVSEGLFSLNRKTGDTQWVYTGAILNSAVALGNGRVYFLETRGGTKSPNGRTRLDQFFGGAAFLVALDGNTGRKLWEIPVKLPFQHIVYLCYAPPVDAVLVTGTFNAKVGAAEHLFYGLRAFRSDRGTVLWERDVVAGSPGGDHGEQWQHPVILRNEVMSKYFRCDLRTGVSLPNWKFNEGGGCGTLSASASGIFFRGGNPRMVDLNTGTVLSFNRVSRPGCFINIIPAGGVVSVPEASAGCTCNYPLQGSFAYVPND